MWPIFSVIKPVIIEPMNPVPSNNEPHKPEKIAFVEL